MVGCCCVDEPCCAHRLFRTDGKNRPSLVLTLESRQRWQAFSIPGCSPLTVPPTTTITSQDITLTYQNPIPSAFLSGGIGFGPPLGAWDDFFFPSQGWYLGPSVTLWAVSGDPVWTGSKTPITGRYFFASCRFGIWLDSDTSIATDTPGISPAPEWQNYIGRRRCEWVATESDVRYYYGHASTSAGSQAGPQYALLTDGRYVAGSSTGYTTDVRGYILKDLSSLACRPIFGEEQILTQSQNAGGTPCDSGSSAPGRYLAPMRLQETYSPNTNSELNPLNTNMGSVSSTPPSAVLALESTHYVEEQFHLLFTISEP